MVDGMILDAEFEEVGVRRDGERLGGDRRAPRVELDPLFAISLIARLSPPETPRGAYRRVRDRRGIVANLHA